MKRAGFTMIELIFVIVILGILAAVALPKFAGVSDQANAQKCAAFVGTLNRTVGPSMWSSSLGNGTNGSVTSFTYGNADSDLDIETYIAKDDIPNECLDTDYTFISGTPAASNRVGNVAFGTNSYSLNFTNGGNLSASPRWTWVKQ